MRDFLCFLHATVELGVDEIFQFFCILTNFHVFSSSKCIALAKSYIQVEWNILNKLLIIPSYLISLKVL